MKTTAKDKSNIVYYDSEIFTTTTDRVSSQQNNSSVVIPHVCNNINLFGAGFAAAIDKKFPIVKENFHLLGNKAKLGYVQYINVYNNKLSNNSLVIANMIAQNKVISHNNPRPLNYEALVRCMIDVRNYCSNIKNLDTKIEIHCPKFGSGLAGGNWNFIEQLIIDIWSQFPVFIYSYNRAIK